jgi:hypothetical protein
MGSKGKMSTWIDGTWDKAVALAENGGSDGVSGSVGGMCNSQPYV